MYHPAFWEVSYPFIRPAAGNYYRVGETCMNVCRSGQGRS